jgi:predicted phage-related endonuclease
LISDEQRERRRRGIGGSDAVRLMAGRWEEVYAAKVHGLAPDLADNLKVRIGVALEPLALACLAEAEGIEIVDPGPATRTDAEFPWMICHPDGLVVDPGFFGPVEVKVTWAHASAESGIAYYYAQLQHNVRVLDADGIWYGQLAMGGRGPSLQSAFVPRDDAYIARLLEVEQAFWAHVAAEEAPDDQALAERGYAPPAAEVAALVTMDLRTSNSFVAAERDWLEHEDGARAFAAAERALRQSVPSEAGIAFGHALALVRDRRGLGVRRLEPRLRAKLNLPETCGAAEEGDRS